MNRLLLRVCLVCLFLLVSLVVVRFAIQSDSREDWLRTEGRLVEVKYALEDYRADNGRYPSQAEGLDVLLQRPPRDRTGPRYFIGQYVGAEDTLIDAWGRAIGYQAGAAVGDGCEVISLGRDGRPGGSGLDEDIRLRCDPTL